MLATSAIKQFELLYAVEQNMKHDFTHNLKTAILKSQCKFQKESMAHSLSGFRTMVHNATENWWWTVIVPKICEYNP